MLSFWDSGYAWYMEMYFSLYLIIPFLNHMYNGCKSRKEKTVLVLSMIVITSLPSVVNVYQFHRADWWAVRGDGDYYTVLLPFLMKNMFPITYYFIGCWLSEFEFKLTKIQNLVMLVGSIVLSGLYDWWRSAPGVFVSDEWNDNGSLFYVIIGALFVSMFLKLDFSRVPETIKRIIMKLSGLCLGAYLVSYIFDEIAYPILNSQIESMPEKLNYIVVVMGPIALLSLLLSWVLDLIYQLIDRGLQRIAIR